MSARQHKGAIQESKSKCQRPVWPPGRRTLRIRFAATTTCASLKLPPSLAWCSPFMSFPCFILAWPPPPPSMYRHRCLVLQLGLWATYNTSTRSGIPMSSLCEVRARHAPHTEASWKTMSVVHVRPRLRTRYGAFFRPLPHRCCSVPRRVLESCCSIPQKTLESPGVYFVRVVHYESAVKTTATKDHRNTEFQSEESNAPTATPWALAAGLPLFSSCGKRIWTRRRPTWRRKPTLQAEIKAHSPEQVHCDNGDVATVPLRMLVRRSFL